MAVGPDGSPFAAGQASADAIYPIGAGGTAAIDGKGHFRIEGLRPGKYRVGASPPALQTDNWNEQLNSRLCAIAFVEAGRTTRVEFFDLREGTCDVYGRVLWGEEPARVSVSLDPKEPVRDPDLAEFLRGRLGALSAEDGSYRIRGAPAGEATLKVQVNLFTRSYPVRLPDKGEFRFDVRLPRGTTIAGRIVRASDGQPVKGATVGVIPEGRPSYREGTSTGPDGRYLVGWFPPGSYWVEARGPAAPDGRSHDQDLARERRGPIRVEEEAVEGVDFALRQGGAARILVRGPGGKPLPSTTVTVRRDGAVAGGSSAESWDQTGIDGSVLIRGLEPGRHRVDVRNGWFAMPPSAVVDVRAGETVECAIDVDRGTEVRVRLQGTAGAPLVHPSVKFTDSEGREIVATSYEQEGDPSEIVASARLAPGSYRISAAFRGYEAATVPVEVRGGAQEEFTVRLEREGAR